MTAGSPGANFKPFFSRDGSGSIFYRAGIKILLLSIVCLLGSQEIDKEHAV
jgi:hypothetical protein